jgi:hypothetical protein
MGHPTLGELWFDGLSALNCTFDRTIIDTMSLCFIWADESVFSGYEIDAKGSWFVWREGAVPHTATRVAKKKIKNSIFQVVSRF